MDHTLDQLPPEIPHNEAVSDAVKHGATAADILYARHDGVCLIDYAGYRHDHDHDSTMAAFHHGLDPEALAPVRDCSRCADAGLETLEDRLCYRDSGDYRDEDNSRHN